MAQRPFPPRGGTPQAAPMDLGSPGGFDQPGAPPPAQGAPPTPSDNDGDEGVTIAPEAVNYHDAAQNCAGCDYNDNGMCKVLKIQIQPEGACNAWSGAGDTGEPDADDAGGMQGDTHGGYGS